MNGIPQASPHIFKEGTKGPGLMSERWRHRSPSHVPMYLAALSRRAHFKLLVPGVAAMSRRQDGHVDIASGCCIQSESQPHCRSFPADRSPDHLTFTLARWGLSKSLIIRQLTHRGGRQSFPNMPQVSSYAEFRITKKTFAADITGPGGEVRARRFPAVVICDPIGPIYYATVNL